MAISIAIKNSKYDERLVSRSKRLEDVWCKIEETSRDLEFGLDTYYRRNTGSYYTGLKLTQHMINELFESADKEFLQDLPNRTFLEPCVGTGNFVFSYLRKIYELNYTKSDAQRILDNIYVCDINAEALFAYKCLLKQLVQTLWDIEIEDTYFKKNIGGPLLYNVNSDSPSYIKISDVFPQEVIDRGFDIVITNPPYKNLRAEKNKFDSMEEYHKERTKYVTISKDAKKHLKYSSKGVLNLYKLFVEEIIASYSNKGAYINLLVPATILSDKSCESLRTHILEEHKLISINLIGENNPYINAQQSLCTMLIRKGHKTDNIKIVPDFCNHPDNATTVPVSDILDDNTGNSIFALQPHEYEMLKKLRVFPTIKNLPFIVNMRGELDLTANANSITKAETMFPLLRGRNIGHFTLSNPPSEFVESSFVESSPKGKYVKQPRIACQQVVNVHKERRVSFSYIDKNYVLGNSCNFISVNQNEYGIDLYALLGLLNSPIIDWFFKLTSTNNHINNYEIDCFPIPVESPQLKQIGLLTKEFLETGNDDLLDQIYKLSYACYGISDIEGEDKGSSFEECVISLYLSLKNLLPDISINSAQLLLDARASLDSILTELGESIDPFIKKACEHMIEKYQKLKRNELLNHVTFKLSDLDMEMIRAVPQGGNWRNIPEETIKKSQRLMKLTKTGGRTTLYGRIDYQQPSYTITTFFNRPGNGTYIHPIHDRVLSVREAARLQSFPDDYYFYGNQRQVLQQVGNAVPPLLAYHIGKSIIENTGCKTSLDLFCGAGGMTLGFKEAGIKCILGVDNEEGACVTIKANNPEINVMHADITEEKTKDKIVKISAANNVDIVCGGPPCQGFSHAGKRFVDDPRNKLFKDFIAVVAKLKPKIVIMENVEGILTMQKGAVYRQIIDLFTELGYKTEGRKLFAHHYGVPQKRKRVIIICVRIDMDIEPYSLFPKETTKEEKKYVTVYDAISDLENIPCSENAIYISEPRSIYARKMRKEETFGASVNVSQFEDKTPEQLTLF